MMKMVSLTNVNSYSKIAMCEFSLVFPVAPDGLCFVKYLSLLCWHGGVLS